jgi:hypothetical protein
MRNKKTVGAVASDLKKQADQALNPQEIQQATEKEYLDNLVWAVDHARKKVECADEACKKVCSTRDAYIGDFYIVGLLKKERLIDNVLRNYFIPTISCPTPFFDQTLYKYNAHDDNIEFVWTVPDQETCEIFRENAMRIVPEEQSLLKFVLEYYDGTLYKLAKKLNGETDKPGVALKEN